MIAVQIQTMPNPLSFLTLILILTTFTNCAAYKPNPSYNLLPLQQAKQAGASLKDTPLTIHLLPHSHDDVGWKKTVDEYFYGTNMKTSHGAVQFTIQTVLEMLISDPNKKFQLVEMAFLKMWVDEQ
jgi:Glycosyl hydrolases family 38 N-terminal domain